MPKGSSCIRGRKGCMEGKALAVDSHNMIILVCILASRVCYLPRDYPLLSHTLAWRAVNVAALRQDVAAVHRKHSKRIPFLLSRWRFSVHICPIFGSCDGATCTAAGRHYLFHWWSSGSDFVTAWGERGTCKLMSWPSLLWQKWLRPSCLILVSNLIFLRLRVHSFSFVMIPLWFVFV